MPRRTIIVCIAIAYILLTSHISIATPISLKDETALKEKLFEFQWKGEQSDDKKNSTILDILLASKRKSVERKIEGAIESNKLKEYQDQLFYQMDLLDGTKTVFEMKTFLSGISTPCVEDIEELSGYANPFHIRLCKLSLLSAPKTTLPSHLNKIFKLFMMKYDEPTIELLEKGEITRLYWIEGNRTIAIGIFDSNIEIHFIDHTKIKNPLRMN